MHGGYVVDFVCMIMISILCFSCLKQENDVDPFFLNIPIIVMSVTIAFQSAEAPTPPPPVEKDTYSANAWLFASWKHKNEMQLYSHCHLSEPSASAALSFSKQNEDNSGRIRLLEENVTRHQEELVSAKRSVYLVLDRILREVVKWLLRDMSRNAL